MSDYQKNVAEIFARIEAINTTIENRNAEIERLRGRCEQHLDDLGVIRLMIDPDSRFKAETVVWIVNWLRGHKRIQPPKKTEKGWA